MTKPKKSKSPRSLKKAENPKKITPTTDKSEMEESEYGGIPMRDLKKNLGC